MKHTHVIWDFNGTLLNDVETGIKSVNTLLERRNMRTVKDAAEYRSYFEFPIINYYKRLGLCTSEKDFEVPAHEWVREYMKNVRDATLYDGAEKVLGVIRKSAIPQILLSASKQSMLEEQLKDLGIYEYFDEILGTDDIYAYGKSTIAEMWATRHPGCRAIIFGDTVHDAEVAKLINADCVLLSYGHQGEEILRQCGAPVISSISDTLLFV